MVHREHNDFTNVRLVGQKHHNSVYAGSATTVRRGAVLEGVHHAAEAVFDLFLTIARNFKGFEHDLWAVIPNRTTEQLIAIACQVILIPQHLQRITLKGLHTPLWHRKWVVLKIDLAGFFILLINREINNPGKREALFVRQAQFIANHHPRFASNPFEGFWFAAQEERRITNAKPQLLTNSLCSFRTDILSQWASGLHAVTLVAPENIAHAGQTFFLRKRIHAITEFSAATFWRRNGANLSTFLF